MTLRPGRASFPAEPAPLPPARAKPTVEQLVRRLVERLAADGAATRPGPAHEDRDPRVMLDVEVEGVRCVLIREPDAPSPASDQRGALSPREMEIVRMIAQGHPNKTIAHVLEISTWTVGTHLRRVFAKLGVSSRAAMVANLARADVLHQPLITPREPRA
jgi:DNA-binding CsgD family transcriptional regulator